MKEDILREGDKEWSSSVAELIADSLLDAKVIRAADFSRAVEIAAEEIFVRLNLNDRPPAKP